MIVTCEQCGRRYRIDDSRFSKEFIKARCAVCGHVFVITLREASGMEPEENGSASGARAGISPRSSEDCGGRNVTDPAALSSPPVR